MSTKCLKPFIFKFFTLIIFIVSPISHAFSEDVKFKEPFTIDDYFKIKRVTELALSSDGQMIACAVEIKSIEENRTLRYI